jgi:DNA-binding NtrC family response regulator
VVGSVGVEGMSSIIQVSINFDPSERSFGDMKSEAITKFDRQFVEQLLSRHKGNVSAAAREAQMDRKHLYDLARKHGLR